MVADLSLLLIAAIWGTTFALLRESLRHIHPVELMAFRFTIAAVLVGAIYWRRIASMRALWLWDGARTGLLLAAGYLFQVFGLATITASRSAFITSTYVPMTPLAAFLLIRIRPDIGGLIGVALVTLGLFAFSATEGFGSGGAAFALSSGDLWTIACAAAFALQMIYTNVAARRSDYAAITFVQLALSAAIGWVLVAARGGLSVPLERVPWGIIVYLATAATAFVLTLQTWALGQTTPVKAAVIFSTEPIFAAIFAGAFFGERMAAQELMGAAFILAGVFVTELWAPVRRWLRERCG